MPFTSSLEYKSSGFRLTRHSSNVHAKTFEMPKVNKREAKRAGKGEVKGATKATGDVLFSSQFVPGKFLTYSRYNEQDLVHVREFETLGDRTYPTKRGVSFTPARLRVLLDSLEEIDENLKQQNPKESYKVQQSGYKKHLGAAVYAAVNEKFDGVDLRRYWMPEGKSEAVPTKNGIYLPTKQWMLLKQKFGELLLLHPELTLAETCFHQNQLGMLDCRECDPFGSFREFYGF